MAIPQLERPVAAPASMAVVLPFPGAGRVAPSPRPQVQAPLRLTRRGRRVVAGLSIAFGVSVAAAIVATESGGATTGLELAGSATIVVQPGDTLWSIAGEVAPEEDRRAVVDALLDVNGLSGVDLVPGQVLALP
ncbi:LysM peptidoglycan-binding domain-containing protein [Modestobacter sp. VKM Ac-2985]|uniref:LysM peptidoglycan-binding domain-containing protein n=1 Tax=Modestobacter sp. VKM Ac-2985 TaxID=3004139 RepID=UPI0022ABAD9A|nr:LysM peptidoglycan-binding domain-containing protein [Modestobacter sp. VKM Ac-2985]MCZ2840037.1 LysM peptidoglycan-binding domain-containing protein [Modestobacter sp. VKM Ac-2985]